MASKALIKCALLSLLLLSGCAGVTPKEFYAKQQNISDANVCKVYIDQFCSSAPKSTSHLSSFHQDIKKEVERRYLGCGTCRKALNIRNTRRQGGASAARVGAKPSASAPGQGPAPRHAAIGRRRHCLRRPWRRPIACE